MKKNKLLTVGILLLFTLNVFAQKTIKGKVVEKTSGEGLPGVSIVVKGSSSGTSTDFDGNFELRNINDGSILVFSYVGFKTQEVTVTTNTVLQIEMEDAAQSLEEVVVIGYGTALKKDLTGSVAAVGSKDFNKGAVVSPQQLIQGKVAGVQITSGGGAPGDGQTIRIRGTGSLSLTSNPLIVVDGVPLNDASIGGSRNVLNAINPNDIATMTVLKDASSTAIFGSRAANGVIMITTKKGRLNQETKFSFSSNVSMGTLNDRISVLNADQFKNLINTTGTPDQIALLGNASTNWQDEIYQVAVNSVNDFNVTGSVGKVPYRLSVGYTDTNGILKSDNLKRTTGKLTLTPKFFDDHLKVELNASGSYIENQFANRDAIGSAIGYDPTQPVFDATSKYAGYSTWIDPATNNKYNLAPTNPLAQLNLKSDVTEVRRFIGNAKLDYKLHFLPDVTAVANVGIDVANSDGTKITDPRMPVSNNNFNGTKETFENKAENSLFDFYLNYNKTLNEDHTLGVTAGYSYQKFVFDDSSQNNEYFINTADNIVKNTIDKKQNVLTSFFGRANYNYKDKYLVTASLRADASSLLNPNDRWGYFPSVALAWNMSKENFLIDSEVINNLKLRVGYGEVGNVNGLNPYQYLTRYTRSTDGASYQFGDSYFQTYRPEPINEKLKWEIANTLNAGIDYSLFDNRINGSLDVYLKKTQDLIANSTVDPFTNFGNRIDRNIGDMENKGIEFLVNVTPIRTDDFDWTVSYNVSYNTNKITKLPDAQNVGGISGGVNNTVQRHEIGLPAFSYYVYQQVYDENKKPVEGVYVDRNNDGNISDADRYFYKDPNADLTMGLSTTLNYKSWDLNVVTRASFGNYAYNNAASALSYATRATENNILSNLSTDYLNSGFQFLTDTNLLSDYYITDASFFKIDNITLGYTLPRSFIENVGLRIYTSAQNVLTVTDYKGLDPEIHGGIDNNFYPRPQTFLLGVNVNF